MSKSAEQRVFWILIIISVVTAGLLYLGPEDLLGDATTTEFALKTMLYPVVLGFLVLAWRRIDRNLKNSKPGEEE